MFVKKFALRPVVNGLNKTVEFWEWIFIGLGGQGKILSPLSTTAQKWAKKAEYRFNRPLKKQENSTPKGRIS